MNLEFIELELDWPSELTIYDLKKYILSNLTKYGVPLRWAITSLTSHAGRETQKISIEAVLITNENKKNINTNLS